MAFNTHLYKIRYPSYSESCECKLKLIDIGEWISPFIITVYKV